MPQYDIERTLSSLHLFSSFGYFFLRSWVLHRSYDYLEVTAHLFSGILSCLFFSNCAALVWLRFQVCAAACRGIKATVSVLKSCPLYIQFHWVLYHKDLFWSGRSTLGHHVCFRFTEVILPDWARARFAFSFMYAMRSRKRRSRRNWNSVSISPPPSQACQTYNTGLNIPCVGKAGSMVCFLVPICSKQGSMVSSWVWFDLLDW